ncbi:lipid-A-disaccharide synthase [Legionella oakridgensis]|uniref:Lipid-A-disaccharide synthase n=2 Tax=Legionella oakridgensis TaxID=29423 RepID=W0BFD6_9GAMM|nr:lipid-A-disaccharide synthase [Legionella oakridgensis]AHE67154.1 lipid-A-disaccharide synthase [Legionella oakridgensis ATCC 33761 = DSM 21215]ETO93125.1 lipid-A-disaccharide synthase [Legionella oakridgensis RV-2-2007]KTD38039.1 lipid-A-disaccharide synthase [Legionella oakridgensis]STY20239.1 lipid-A-disaccharide synthase [Legionella longbeachae]
MQPIKRLVIIAGEESGDIHAAAIIRELQVTYPALQISGIGGQHMQKAGATLISDLARFGVTGISEVVRHLHTIKKAFKDIKAHLKENKPDLLILVDYPGFNLRLAKYAKQELGLRILYYISPQIWAWKAGRIKTIRDNIDHMAVIFPFEKKLYENAGVPVTYVGHPLVEKINNCPDMKTARHTLGLPQNKRLIAMLPGSRTHEIERHMPILVSSAQQLTAQFSDLHFVIPIASTIDSDMVNNYFTNYAIDYTLIQGNAMHVVAGSNCVIVASGTASLECALLEKPMCIIYKASLLTFIAASKLMKVKYLGLCNLLQNKMIVPELLQYDCNPLEVTRLVSELLMNPNTSQGITKRLHMLKSSLSIQQADCKISALIEREMNKLNSNS